MYKGYHIRKKNQLAKKWELFKNMPVKADERQNGGKR